jgi:hypothetical protein
VTLLEAVFVLGTALVVGTVAVASVGEWRARSRSLGAARLVMMQVRVARALAVREGVQVGLVFRENSGDTVFRVHRDGNGNGLRKADVDRGIDPPTGPETRLEDWFAGTALRIPATMPGLDPGTVLTAGSRPVRLSGGGSILSCGPSGTTASGTLYVAGARGDTLAVRILGSTGRLRLFEYAHASGQWRERW